MDQYIGRLLDNRYEILEIIGTGGMAVVYKARCHRLNRLVAIKILKDEYARDEEFRRRFRAEGEAVAMLSHPNIVQVYDVSSSDTANFIVMELVDGISLKQYMEKKGVLNWKETLHFAMQIAKGLEHAHSRGIVHRDIKPHNVMVLKNGSVKVMDFGIARVMSKSNTLTKEALGSVHYISPEQAKGGWVDNRSDLYSLSVVMYEMMAGRPPYDGESPVAVAIQHINGGAAMPSTLNPNIPGGLEQIIMKGMSLDANDRYPSATAMLKDMDDFRKDPGILFHYGQVNQVPVDATQPINLGAINRQTTADKVARRNEGGKRTGESAVSAATNRIRTSTGTAVYSRQRSDGQRRQNGTQRRMPGSEERSYPPQRKSRETIEAERRSRLTTMAIVGCSAVAVIAIVIWLVALTSGALFNQGKELVEVPDLIGEIYAPIMEGFTVEYGKPSYNNTAAANTIINQEPQPGDMVQKGTAITVNVSLGPAPEVKTMTNLAGQTLEDAMTFLRNQGMNPLPKDEYHDVVEEGKVIRTDPEIGAELTDGQTVYVYYSKGPIIKTAEMPNLIGQNYATAYNLLTQMGFTAVSSDYVESNEPKDEVVDQPYERGTAVDITEKIVLKVSKGPKTTAKMPNVVGKTFEAAKKTLEDLGFTNVASQPVESDEPKGQVVEQPFRVNAEVNKAERITLKVSEGPKPTEATEPPTTAPTEPEPETIEVTFTLPAERTEAYVVSIFYNGKEVVEARQVEAGTASISVKLTGVGKQTYDIYINDEFYNSQEVNFGD